MHWRKKSCSNCNFWRKKSYCLWKVENRNCGNTKQNLWKYKTKFCGNRKPNFVEIWNQILWWEGGKIVGKKLDNMSSCRYEKCAACQKTKILIWNKFHRIYPSISYTNQFQSIYSFSLMKQAMISSSGKAFWQTKSMPYLRVAVAYLKQIYDSAANLHNLKTTLFHS